MRRGRRPAGMFVDPAQTPTALMEPSMEPGQSSGPVAPTGWQCPSCHRVYAPWVACCGTCGPQDADTRTEISEGLAEGLRAELPAVRSGLDKVAEAVRSARGGDAPVQIRGFA